MLGWEDEKGRGGAGGARRDTRARWAEVEGCGPLGFFLAGSLEDEATGSIDWVMVMLLVVVATFFVVAGLSSRQLSWLSHGTSHFA